MTHKPTKKENAYEIDQVSFAYDKDLVLQDMTFDIPKGALTCFLGNNGSGKTTLLDCMLGLHKPKNGAIQLYGQDIGKISPATRALMVAYIPQHHSESFPYTVQEIVLMGRNPYMSPFDRIKEDDYQRTDEALDLMGILPLKHRIYSQLSGGEMKLVLFARAYVQDTDIILMDEPTASLDMHNERVLLKRIAYLILEKGKTIVMSSHSINHLLFLDSENVDIEILMLKNGQIYYKGSIDETLKEDHIYTTYGVKTKILSHIDESGKIMKSLITL